MVMYSIYDNVTKISGIGDKYKFLLDRLSIYTIEDLILYAPFRYEDKSNITTISNLNSLEAQGVVGSITEIKNVFTRFGKRFTKAILEDETGKIDIIWFNQPYLVKSIAVGTKLLVYGKLDSKNKKPTLLSPEFEKIYGESPTIHAGKIVPIYPLTEGVSSKWLRAKIAYALKSTEINNALPDDVISKHNLLERKNAIETVHFPENIFDTKLARHTLSFEELFFIHLKGLIQRKNWESIKNGHIINLPADKLINFYNELPFKLTKAQTRCIDEILIDLAKSYPMNRLLQGDVGSGKTMVALIAALAATNSKFNVIYLAPTQILAKQHFQTFSKFLAKEEVDIHLLLSDKKDSPIQKSELPYIIIGTHAILHHLEDFDNVGLIIIDEQHKFGVKQRSKVVDHYTLSDSENRKRQAMPAMQASSYSSDLVPNLLTMTATPIPRSVALTLYGDLSLSVIDELPKNRKTTKTFVINESKRESCYRWMKDEMTKNKIQSIVVCPFIEESENDELKEVKAAEKEFKDILRDFKEFKVGLLHGKMKDNEKNEMIKKFQDYKLDILVTTPVIEVGVDIPNANIIFIESAERFGLASLHQLRGRVGRGDKQGHCVLMSSSFQSITRLKYMENIHSGQKLAEIDFKLRGPGNIYGTEQHGVLSLKVADITDIELIKQTKDEATKFLAQNNSTNEYTTRFISNIELVEKN